MTPLSPHIELFRLRASAIAAALMLLCVAAVLWPAQALAAAGLGRCVDAASYQTLAGAHGFFVDDNEIDADLLRELLSIDVGVDAVTASAPRPCAGGAGGESGDADASSNLCFADASEPISTLPRLIAQWRGEQEAAEVVDSLLRALNLGGDDFLDAEVSDDAGLRRAQALLNEPTLAAISLDPLQRATPRPQPGEQGLSCATAAETCHALPPLLQLPDITAAVSLSPVHPGFGVPTIDVPAAPPFWVDAAQGPRAGHARLPDQPPRRHPAAPPAV